MSEWIQCSVREPTEADYPIVTEVSGELCGPYKRRPDIRDFRPDVWWKSIGRPDPKPTLILRHPDGTEEVIHEPVYTFPRDVIGGDEYYCSVNKSWEPTRPDLNVNFYTIRRRLA